MKSFRLRAVLLTVTVFFPFAAFARSASEIVDTSVKTVTRAQFLSWSVEALDVFRESPDCELPFTRVPKGMRTTLCSAKTPGALESFVGSKTYPFNERVTRGEALVILTALTGKRETEIDVSAYKDVRTEREKQAVRNAIVLKWMTPVRANSFGITRPMSGPEVLTLLQAVVGQGVARTPNRITITLPELDRPVSGSLPKQDLLDAIWMILKRDYLHADKISEEEAAYKAAEAIVSSLGDPYTTFFRPAGASDFQQQLKGELSGIGAQVEDKGGIITVIAPLPGSPAEKAGLRPADEILMVGDKLITGLGVEKAVQLIRGEKGTVAELKVRRGGIEMLIRVTRDVISIPEIDVKWQGDIAIVQLTQFGQTTDRQIRSIFADVVKRNPKGVILDLRNNGGGLLHAADMVVSNFVPRGTIVAKVRSTKVTRDEVTEYEATLSPSTKVVVLVNKGSASASEIVAGALQDHKRATIVGTVTFGKGTVQEVLSFPSGEALKITTAEWLTPLERPLDGVGVKPDVMIETENRDEQLKKALDLLR